MFGENEFVSEYDAGKFAGVVYGINQRSDTLAESFAGDGAGNAGNDAGSTWYRRCMRCEVGSSTKLAPSRRVSTKIGSASSLRRRRVSTARGSREGGDLEWLDVPSLSQSELHGIRIQTRLEFKNELSTP